MSKKIIGIDFGSKFSLVALKISQNSEILLAQDKKGQIYIPSIVSILKRQNVDIMCGNFAKVIKYRSPLDSIFDIKCILGHRFDDQYIQQMEKKWPFKLEPSSEGDVLIHINSVDKNFQPYEIAGELLKYLAEIGNSMLPAEEKTNNVVITVPSHFSNVQRNEMKKAAQYAGLNIMTLLNETEAACIAYTNMSQPVPSEKVLIFDLGARFLEVSLFKVNGRQYEIEATDGDSFLGGSYFEENVVDFLLNKFHLDDDFRQNKKKMSKLFDIANTSIIELSCTNKSEILLDIDDDDDDEKEYTFKIEEFEEINRNLIDRLLLPVQRIVNSHLQNKNEINKVILVGGATAMRCVKRKLTEYFGFDPIYANDPTQTVPLGVGLAAFQLSQDKELKFSNQFEKSYSYSIGTKSNTDQIITFFPKGVDLPSSNVMHFKSIFYRQHLFKIDIYENDLYIGQLTYPDLPLPNNGDDQTEFDIRFNLDQYGNLSASIQFASNDDNDKQPKEMKFEIKRNNAHESEVQQHQNQEKEEKDDNNNNNNNDDDDEIGEINNEYQVFFINIQRFISFNFARLEEFYPRNVIENYMKEAKFKEKNSNVQQNQSIADYCHYYLSAFKKYFKKYQIPYFLRE